MVRIIVVTHGGLAQELVQTAEMIVGTQQALTPICLETHEGIEDLKTKLSAVLAEAAPAGVLVLVDMFGGTPSNVALELSQHRNLKVLTGVNLPMLLEAITHRTLMDAAGLAEFVNKRGRQSIFNATDLFAADPGRENP